jgi:hypothetical protein
MAPEERERNFDKALGRRLRSIAAVGQSAPTPAGSAAQSASCPDSETLAAYHERSLLPEEMNSWKEHLVGCAHCQAILSELELTDSIRLQGLAATESVSVVTARRPEPIRASAAPVRSRRILLLRGARWQWLAPAGAIAASLLVWIALHEKGPLPVPSLKRDEIAMRQAPAPLPAAPSAVTQGSSSPRSDLIRPQSRADEPAALKARVASKAMKRNETLADQTMVSPSNSVAGKESDLHKDAERSRAADLLREDRQLDRDAKSVPSAKQENVQVQLQAQAAVVASQNQNIANARKSTGPAPMGQVHTDPKLAKAAAAPPAPPPGPAAGLGGAAGYSDVASSEIVAGKSNPRLIAPPGSAFLWRAGRAGVIDFSRDAGASWSSQSSGVLVDLFAGSAPSDNVCWIVGRLGTILLTTDGGAHWKLLASPTKDDIGGVQATDALHGRVWNSRNTKIFETSDGGLTWRSVSNP